MGARVRFKYTFTLEYNMKIECSICEQTLEEEDLIFLGKRADIHRQGRHEKHNVIGQRPYQGNKLWKSMGGMIMSNNVEWITL